MKKSITLFAASSIILFSASCSTPSGASQSTSVVKEFENILPKEEATALAEAMASKIGLNTDQKSTVYSSLFNYFTQKKDLYTKLKSNTITQAILSAEESKITNAKNATIKSVMSNNTQLANLEQMFGIK